MKQAELIDITNHSVFDKKLGDSFPPVLIRVYDVTWVNIRCLKCLVKASQKFIYLF